ncbi:pyridoxal-dependent decarboxylase [Nonomuraea jabiensis]|uniref:pyridoxal-dependent decarboxylase n=1 Tax=Nonomuraea jabiensis TaxID=882448 RepID=UPI003D71CA6C
MRMLRQWGVHTTHPRYFGLFNPTPTWWDIAGEVLAAGVNPQLAAYTHAPAAVEMERHVLRFVAGRLGLPTAEGSFKVGGADANLTAVIVALTRRFPAYAGGGLASLARRPVLYASAESHLAWLKIAHMTGLGRDAVRLVPTDSRHRMDLAALRETHRADLAAGFEPLLLIGTTAGGSAGSAAGAGAPGRGVGPGLSRRRRLGGRRRAVRPPAPAAGRGGAGPRSRSPAGRRTPSSSNATSGSVSCSLAGCPSRAGHASTTPRSRWSASPTPRRSRRGRSTVPPGTPPSPTTS